MTPSAADGLEWVFGSIVGPDNLTSAATELVRHGSDESYHPAAAPDLVVYPRSTADVVAVVRECQRLSLPIVPFGAGTSLEGHVAALHGGICLDMSRMDRILELRSDDLDVTLEAGVTRLQLERAAGPQGLFFPVDPGADATLGGMISTGASGTTAVRYGTMRENVLALTVVLADGTVLRTRSRARKSSAGYDMTHLFVGAEGTLGVITEAVLRLHPIPEQTAAAVCSFRTVEQAVRCVTATIQSGVPVARAELLDEILMGTLLHRHELPYAVAPTLLLDLHGSAAALREQSAEVAALVAASGDGQLAWVEGEADRRRLWQIRHRVTEAAMSLRPGAGLFPTDVCVPISRLAECIAQTREDIAASGLIGPVLGHVGDGNFHALLLVDADDPAEVECAMRVSDRLARRAIAMDGTCTGEHGVGYGKLALLELEHGGAGVGLMAALKHAVDPQGIFNPGKVGSDPAPRSADQNTPGTAPPST